MDLQYLADGNDKHNHDDMWMKEPYIDWTLEPHVSTLSDFRAQ